MCSLPCEPYGYIHCTIHDVHVHVCEYVILVPQVRDKMVYAATKATVKKAFQSGVVVDDIAATRKVLVYLICDYTVHVVCACVDSRAVAIY